MGWTVVALAAGLSHDALAAGKAAPHHYASSRHAKPSAKVTPDLSGRQRVGKASVYAKKLAGRKMADGTRMKLHDDNAASKTLPLGTTAKVTNLETGQSANITIQDRGPHAKDRIVDLSPATAQKIGITKGRGVARVCVDPIAIPMPDGSVKHGATAKDGAKKTTPLRASRAKSKAID
jgi:rare lipoprotein A